MARPKKKAADTCTRQLPPVRCTESDYTAIQARAKKANMTITQFIRQMALTGQVVVKESQTDFQEVHQLKRIGTNLNQLTRLAHTSGVIPIELAKLYKQVGEYLDRKMTT